MKRSERSSSNSRIKLLENINTPGKYNFDYSLRNKNQDAQNSLPPTDKASSLPKNGLKYQKNNSATNNNKDDHLTLSNYNFDNNSNNSNLNYNDAANRQAEDFSEKLSLILKHYFGASDCILNLASEDIRNNILTNVSKKKYFFNISNK